MKAGYEKQINQLRSEGLSKENMLMETYNQEKKSLDSRHQERERSLLEKIAKLEESNYGLNDKKLDLESQLKDATSRLRIIDRDYITVKRENDSFKEENTELTALKYSLEREKAALEVGATDLGSL